MRPFLLRLASLACGLVLVLPPGLCCLWLHGPTRTAEAPAKPRCPCCDPPATPTDPEARAPVPPPPCPCADRAATPPAAVKPPAVLVCRGLAAALPAADLAPAAAPDRPEAALSLPLPSAPLNVLHCVWLC